tara:strand:- start:119 stop:340 length:222 start_codon:yes stop_codon:yes gene_type:complete
MTVDQQGVVVAALVAAVRQSLFKALLAAVKADIFSPDRVVLAVLVDQQRVFLVVVAARRVLQETVVAMTVVGL